MTTIYVVMEATISMDDKDFIVPTLKRYPKMAFDNKKDALEYLFQDEDRAYEIVEVELIS